MLIFHGGQKVGRGTYWSAADGMRLDVDRDGTLPGDDKSSYYRLSPAVMVIMGPFIGLAYVICLPFIGIATIMAAIARKGVGLGVSLIKNLVSFGWRPSESYLAGKKKKEDGPDKK
ncbi:MAG TPA: hypothetical protein VN260_03750 [Dissulfurispiraceae bacterium]|nr:hypothetical protein [Dissulfurispiraceae bacterium]